MIQRQHREVIVPALRGQKTLRGNHGIVCSAVGWGEHLQQRGVVGLGGEGNATLDRRGHIDHLLDTGAGERKVTAVTDLDATGRSRADADAVDTGVVVGRIDHGRARACNGLRHDAVVTRSTNLDTGDGEGLVGIRAIGGDGNLVASSVLTYIIRQKGDVPRRSNGRRGAEIVIVAGRVNRPDIVLCHRESSVLNPHPVGCGGVMPRLVKR